jgi:hypothetical protein
MDQVAIRAGIDKTKEHVVVQIDVKEKALAHILLSGPDAEAFINEVAKQRSALAEGVIPDLDPGYRVTAMVDPTWRMPNHRIQQGRILHVRHPGMGWLTFVFPEKQAAQIAEWLTKDLPLKEI